MSWWAVLMVSAIGLSTFYALGRWHGEWRYGNAYRAGHRAGYRACQGDMARTLNRPRRAAVNERAWRT